MSKHFTVHINTATSVTTTNFPIAAKGGMSLVTNPASPYGIEWREISERSETSEREQRIVAAPVITPPPKPTIQTIKLDTLNPEAAIHFLVDGHSVTMQVNKLAGVASKTDLIFPSIFAHCKPIANVLQACFVVHNGLKGLGIFEINTSGDLTLWPSYVKNNGAWVAGMEFSVENFAAHWLLA